jgi:uncharacterized lipoprotein
MRAILTRLSSAGYHHQMRVWRLRGLLVVTMGAIVFCAAGCALTVDRIPLTYGRQPAVLKVANAERVAVLVKVDDTRKDRARVSCKKNGWGMELAAIESTVDVPAFVRTNIEWELKRRGFVAGPDGVVVEVELRRFWNDFKMGVFAGDAVAELIMDVRAFRAADGPQAQPIYLGHFEGEGKNENIQICSGENAKVALDAAFDDAMKTLFGDRRFLAALSATTAPAPTAVLPPAATPAAPSVTPAGPAS